MRLTFVVDKSLSIYYDYDKAGLVATDGQRGSDLKRIHDDMQRDGEAEMPDIHARTAALPQLLTAYKKERHGAIVMAEMTPAKRRRLIRTYGRCPAGYTRDDLERILDVTGVVHLLTHTGGSFTPPHFASSFPGFDS